MVKAPLEKIIQFSKKYRFAIAGFLGGLSVPIIKLFGDYVFFNPSNLNIIPNLIFQLQNAQQAFDYGLMTFGSIAVLTGGGIALDKLLEQSLEAYKDPLTGAYNKRYLEKTEISLRKKVKGSCVVALIDLDNFKPVNDLYGHQAGDQALKDVNKIFLDELKRGGDLVIRYGGDEFLLILASTTLKDARKIIKRMRTKVEDLQYGTTHLGFSVGLVTERNPKNINLSKLIHKADKRMYVDKAKRKGRVANLLSFL